MALFIVNVMLQDVQNESAYEDLDVAMAEEEGYPYVTDDAEKIYALPPDSYEFDLDITAEAMLNLVKLVCSQIERKHNLKKSPIVVVEAKDIRIANLEELDEADFAD